jgi:hypothetical protein
MGNQFGSITPPVQTFLLEFSETYTFQEFLSQSLFLKTVMCVSDMGSKVSFYLHCALVRSYKTLQVVLKVFVKPVLEAQGQENLRKELIKASQALVIIRQTLKANKVIGVINFENIVEREKILYMPRQCFANNLLDRMK